MVVLGDPRKGRESRPSWLLRVTQLPKATEGFGGGWMLAFCSRPKPLVMKNLTPYLYLTLGREGIGRTILSNPLDLIICPDASRGDGE